MNLKKLKNVAKKATGNSAGGKAARRQKQAAAAVRHQRAANQRAYERAADYLEGSQTSYAQGTKVNGEDILKEHVGKTKDEMRRLQRDRDAKLKTSSAGGRVAKDIASDTWDRVSGYDYSGAWERKGDIAGDVWEGVKDWGRNLRDGKYNDTLSYMKNPALAGAGMGAVAGAFSSEDSVVGSALSGAAMGAGLSYGAKKISDVVSSSHHFTDKINELQTATTAMKGQHAEKVASRMRRREGMTFTQKINPKNIEKDIVEKGKIGVLGSNIKANEAKLNRMQDRLSSNYNYGLEKRATGIITGTGLLASNIMESNDPY